MANAPINAQIPIACAPRKAPSPKKIAQVAPSDAPDETPKIYGSAKGFFTTACMIIPESVKPMPTQAARIIRGIRSIQTTSTRSLLISVAAKSPAFINNISTISVHAKEIKPNFKPKIIMQSMVRNSNSRRYFTFIFFICAVIAKFIIYT